jgi:hypothetical protein
MKKLLAAVFAAALYSTAAMACHDKADTTASNTKKETKTKEASAKKPAKTAKKASAEKKS